MAVNLSCRLVFLASPGGLARERERCRRALIKHHEARALDTGATFLVQAWEDVPGGVGRPQDLINPTLDRCDYLLMLLGDSWGSPPDLQGAHSSGTEEEFRRAVTLLADPAAPMRDILILFKTLTPDRLRDPGPQLSRVMAFRTQLERSKSLMYGTFDSDESLIDALSGKLTVWAEPLITKVPKVVQLLDDETIVVRNAPASREELLTQADSFAAEGLHMQAEAAYSRAIGEGDPTATAKYAQFMRRTGRFEQALALNRSLLNNDGLLLSNDATAITVRSNTLANIGVIERKQGKMLDSARSLQEAVNTARTGALDAREALCYALDNYGYTLLASGRAADAADAFREAHSVRAAYGSPQERAQSSINLARFELNQGNYDQALQLFLAACDLLGPDDHLLANALSGIVEARLTLGKLDGLDGLLAQSLALNERQRNSDGLSIVHGLTARLHIDTGDMTAAAAAVESLRLEATSSGNNTGKRVADELQAEIEKRNTKAVTG